MGVERQTRAAFLSRDAGTWGLTKSSKMAANRKSEWPTVVFQRVSSISEPKVCGHCLFELQSSIVLFSM